MRYKKIFAQDHTNCCNKKVIISIIHVLDLSYSSSCYNIENISTETRGTKCPSVQEVTNIFHSLLLTVHKKNASRV